ncbi:MAG: dihydrolipoyl dehydrogenase [Candidatus Eremiobacteraeota bacterium]|nr:dihydrolipoyl dehydrogenase [Candidatus Eremiobacteraeota bacterium]
MVIGAGSGGYAAARTARGLGASVALVDHGPLGGLCILRGCMPSKTLIASSDLVADIRDGAELGVTTGPPKIDLAHIFDRKRDVIAGFADYRIEGIKSFPLYEGLASFESEHVLRVGSDVRLEAANFVIATGSVVAPPAIPGLIEAGYLDSDAVLESAKVPKSLVVLGGGYVGSELGQFLARMGVETTFLIRAKHLLSSEDKDVGDAVTFYFRAEGIDVRTGVSLSHVEVRDGKKVVHYTQDGQSRSIAADEIFYALGRVPNIAGLELERAGIVCHAITGIDVGPDMRTSSRHIFAVGDVTGYYPLVHVAIYQGEVAARNAILATAEEADYTLQRTHTIFTDPQIAVVGRTEKELQAAGIPYLAGSYLFSEHGKAIAINKTKGFVKMLASPDDGRILGAAVVGPEASDLIHEVIVAMFYNGTVAEFAKIPHLHPTLAEIWTYPAEDIAGQIEARTTAGAVAV